VRVAGRRVDLDTLERLPERAAQCLEAFGWAAFVAGEAQPQDAKAMSGAVLDLAEVGGVETERCPAPGADPGREVRVDS